jgi:hypothetical protein
MKFPAEFLTDLIWLKEGEDYRGTRCVQNKLVDTTRWAEVWQLVFEHEGKYYKTFYELPATEMQEGIDPFDDYEEVNCVEVHPHPVTIIEYREAVK